MATVGGFDRALHLDELNDPINTGSGFVAPATRKSLVRTNMGLTGSIAAINQVGGAAGAVTTTADGLTTGLILVGETVVIITSAAATNAATLPGIAANSLPVGYTIYGRVGANGFELLTPATLGETINGVDADGTNQLDIGANAGFIAVVESATGWWVAVTVHTAPDND